MSGSTPRLLLIALKDLEGPGYVGRYHRMVEQLSRYFDVYLFCARQPWKQRDRDSSAWEAERHVEELVHGYPLPLKNPYLNELLNGPGNVISVRRLVDRWDIDVVVNGSNIFLGLSTSLWKRGRPVAFDLSDYYPELSQEKGTSAIPGPVQRMLEGGIKFCQERSLKSSDIATACSELLFQYVREDVGKSDVYLVSNAVETSHFKPVESTVREDYGIGDDYLIGFGGTISRFFLLEEVVAGFTELERTSDESVSLMIVGDGPNRSAVEEAVAQSEASDKIHTTGTIEYTELPNYYSAFDVGLNPMASGYVTDITRPLKVFEYLACGTPVISTPITELQDYVFRGSSGSTISFLDFPDEFVEECLTIASRGRDREFQAQCREEILGTYDWDTVGTHLAEDVLLPAISR